MKILELQQKGFMQHLRERWLQGVCKTPYTESGGKKKEYRALLERNFATSTIMHTYALPALTRLGFAAHRTRRNSPGLPIFSVSVFEQELSEQGAVSRKSQ